MGKNTRELALMALFVALVTIATMIIQVPTVTNGYVNIGDAMIFFVALTFGKRYGAVCGGVGSALADLLSSYAQYVPVTLIVKGFEGFVVGYLFEKSKKAKWMAPVACLIGAAVMVAGYFIYEATVLSYGLGALGSVPGNIVQGLTSLVIAQVLYFALSKAIDKIN